MSTGSLFSIKVTRELFKRALGGSAKALQNLQNNYLGFTVLRPIPAAPLGRTVVRWYPERFPTTPRVTYPSRQYNCHIAGLTLNVTGLAWQQQDTGVGACATIALWTMLHSSALDEHHAIPTTADITRYAHRTASLGGRIFPSTGLNIYQICEAIKESGLAPIVSQGDVTIGGEDAFSKERFASVVASLIRSGYPILLAGMLEGVGGHAVCAVGFRETSPPTPQQNSMELQDGNTLYLYIHDDNIGPNIRFQISEATTSNQNFVKLSPSTPPLQGKLKTHLPPNPTTNYPSFIPSQIIAAVHNDLRTSPDALHAAGLKVGKTFLQAFDALKQPIGLTMSSYILQRQRYLEKELYQTLARSDGLLARTRLAVYEKLPRMSFHIGLVRLGWGSTPVLDVLYDTTDSDRHLPVFGYVAYHQTFGELAKLLDEKKILSLDVGIDAF